jgi:hypothetical protein
MSSPLFQPFQPFSIAVLGAYAVFYSGYDKTTKKLNAQLLLDIVSVERGWKFTLKEINKVLGLGGLTLLAAPAALSLVGAPARGMLSDARRVLVLHGVFSVGLFSERLASHPKTVATWIGVGALLCSLLAAGRGLYEPIRIGPGPLLLAGLGLGTLHFYTMERDSKGTLQVRPFALTALVAGCLGTAQMALQALA